MARNASGADPEGRRLTKDQAALLNRLAAMDPHVIERGLNLIEATNPDPLSERVRKYVVKTSGGLAEVHRRTGIPKTTLGGWIKGEKDITTSNFDRICEAYGIEPVRMTGEPSEDVPTAAQLGGELSDSDRIRLETELAQAKERLEQASRKSVEIGSLLRSAEAANSSLGIHPTYGSVEPHRRKGGR